MKEVHNAESEMRTYKMIHDSKLDDCKKLKKELNKDSPWKGKDTKETKENTSKQQAKKASKTK